MTVRLAFLASHRGSSARAITQAARQGRLDVEPRLLVHNNQDAPARIWAADEGLRVERLSSVTHPDPADLDRAIRDVLVDEGIDLVILSGWMKRLGPVTVDAFRGRILNVHPAPLPKFGGEGMWGMHVHQAVLESGVRESAVTIHEVDEQYDHGPVLHTQAVDISAARTAEDIQRLVAEHEPEAYVGAVRAFIARTTQGAHRMSHDTADGIRPVRRALVSVFDKTGIEAFAKNLQQLGVEIVSTGSTAQRIADAGIPVTRVSDVTGFPECLDGRVKTLHPMIHAGILADRTKQDHLDQLAELEVEAIDLVVVNLYPFRATVASGASDEEVVEMIDIGGPTMVRSAAKNHEGVAVLVDPADYEAVTRELDELGGTTLATRTRLAGIAFQHTAEYDAGVASWFQRSQEWMDVLPMVVHKQQGLRYGENPHQSAAFYRHGTTPVGLAAAEQLGGKELSYNNILDTNAAWGMAIDFDDPCVAIIKHTNPAGLATAATLAEAYPKSLAGDPVSAFGGIVATNRPIDLATAEQITEVFTEVVIAPGYDDAALEVLRGKANLRILRMPDATRPRVGWDLRSVMGGLLVQYSDVGDEPFEDWKVVTERQPTPEQLADLRFAWVAAKHVKSNAIVLVKDRAVVGVGAGQMSRIDSTRIAADKSAGRVEGSVLASDAFFPFRDGPDAAIDFGVTAIVQPGGSVRDQEVFDAADERGIVMITTGRRHFRH